MSPAVRPRWLEPGDEWNWREGRIVAEDLAGFVPARSRHQSLTVVRDRGDRDLVAEGQQWLDRVRADAATVDACKAIQRTVEKWADGSREGQKLGVLALVRLDERGHRGLPAALDLLWSVRATDARDFWRLVEWARGRVLADPSPGAAPGCQCDPPAGRKIGNAVRVSRASASPVRRVARAGGRPR